MSQEDHGWLDGPPAFEGHLPVWFRPNGTRMTVELLNQVPFAKRPAVLLTSASVTVVIWGHSKVSGSRSSLWSIVYEIARKHNKPHRQRFLVTTTQLECMFGLTGDLESGIPGHADAVLGHTRILPHKYIRYGRYLTFPDPGADKVGDTNVSIEIDGMLIMILQVVIRH